MKNLITEEEIKKSGLEPSQAKELTRGLDVILAEREELKKTYKEVIKLEVTDENVSVFRELRISIKDNRTKGIEKWHKVNKAFFLAGGRFVDAKKNKECDENLYMEEQLFEAEKFRERQEKERIAKLNKERIEAVSPYLEDTVGLDLSGMDDDVFSAYLSTKKSKFEAALAEEKRIEQEQIESKRLDILENKRKLMLAPYGQFFDTCPDLRTISEDDFSEFIEVVLEAKKVYNEEQAAIKAENDRLKKEKEAAAEKIKADEAKKVAEAKEAKESKEKRSFAAIEFIESLGFEEDEFGHTHLELGHFIGADHYTDFDTDKEFESFKEALIKSTEVERLRLKTEKEAKKQADIQAKKDAAIQAELKKEREEAAKLRKEKEDAEAAEARRIADEKAKSAALAKAPVKEKLNLWVDSFELPANDVDNETTKEIQEKFTSFKKWAKTQVEKL